MLTILKSGLLTQWTDSGRRQSQINGYSQSGAVDWFNFNLANALCGKNLSAPVLEVMGGNIIFTVDRLCLISITGACSDLKVNGKDLVGTGPLTRVLEPKDIVEIGHLDQGVFSYIAFSTSFDLPMFAKSVCAVKRENIGGSRGDGSGLLDGEEFEFINKLMLSKSTLYGIAQHNNNICFAPIIAKLFEQQVSSFKMVPFSFCYQSHLFSSIERQRFLSHEYVVSQYIDKMGLRLKGPSIKCERSNLLSQPMANGSIQIPGNGLPIIMRNNRQTIGGYPVIGTVSSAGLAILSQAKPDDSLTFYMSDFDSSSIWRQCIDIQLKQVLNKTRSLLLNNNNNSA
jgi:allophanate hydrolase